MWPFTRRRAPEPEPVPPGADEIGAMLARLEPFDVGLDRAEDLPVIVEAVAGYARQPRWWRQWREGPWTRLLCILAGPREDVDDGDVSFSKRLLHWDTECVEGPGSYCDLVRALARAFEGCATITDVTDHVDTRARTARLHCRINGADVDLTPVVEGDWLDGDVLVDIVGRIEAQCDRGAYFLPAGGQDFFLVVLRRADLPDFEALIGTDLVPVSSSD